MREQEAEERQKNLLEELCGADRPLYDLLSSYLYHSPLAAISRKDLDVLVEEAEESGDFRQAIDKAIFEGTQNPGERERHIEVIKNLASRAMHVAEQAKHEREKEGLAERAASLGRKIEDYRFMSEKTGDILSVASEYYTERLVESDENLRREERQADKRQSESVERAIGEREEHERGARRKESRKLGREERREAKRRAKIEDAAEGERRRAREQERLEAEEEEGKIEEMEKAARDARRNKRMGN
ncbi:hypothetical protein ACFLSW_04375 [Candidatus Bipolaricaulota bacterium]